MPCSTSTTATGPINDHTITQVNQVFGQMQLIFGRKYTSRFGSDNEVKATKRMWARAFMQEQISDQQITFAISRIIKSKIEWPPELPQFLTLCDDPTIYGLPDKDAARQQIIDRNGKHRFKQNFVWLHDVVEVVYHRIGDYTKQAASSFDKHFNKAWETAVTEYKTGTLPPVLQALPAPKLPAISDSHSVPVNKKCRIHQRIEALIQAAKENR